MPVGLAPIREVLAKRPGEYRLLLFICRLFEHTHLTDVQIARIAGPRDPKQLRRYASLLRSDLAPHLW